jgi:RimJ/RimL family protein N-acetyltransferase
MLRGDLTLLRARRDDDIPVLDAELYDDVETRVRADTRPWRPVPPGSAGSTFRVSDIPGNDAVFSVVELATDELAGTALLWHIDHFNRLADVGISLRPTFRGRGLATDAVRVLCRYGFSILGLNRLQLRTLAGNAAMIATATKTGFRHEGTQRRAHWVNGEFLDQVSYGQLAEEWTAH